MTPTLPVTEAELHAYVDGQLTLERQREIEAYLDTRPDEALRVDAYREQKRALHALFDPVLGEPVPRRMRGLAQRSTPWYRHRVAAGVAIAVVSGTLGWALGGADRNDAGEFRPGQAAIAGPSAAGDFVQRAAVAHAVYSPDVRRPVEIGAEHEDQLVAWLSKRMGAPMTAPRLQPLGYTLEGGRLLPGASGPVAQFMYRDAGGARLTLYVSRDIAEAAGTPQRDTAFRFAREGAVNVFYWVDGPFGYAIAAGAGRAELARVSSAVYGQLGGQPPTGVAR